MTGNNEKQAEREAFEAWWAGSMYGQILALTGDTDADATSRIAKVAAWDAYSAALAQQPQSEAVGHVYSMEALVPGASRKYHAKLYVDLPAGTKLYAEPQAAPIAQGLTDDDIDALVDIDSIPGDYGTATWRRNYVRAILAKTSVTEPVQGTQEPSARGQQAVSDADISAALEFMADADSAEKMRSVCRQLRPELVAELARRRIICEKYAPAAPAPSASPAALTDAQIKELAGMHGGYLDHHDSWNFCGDRGLLRFARALLAASPVDQVPDGYRLQPISEFDAYRDVLRDAERYRWLRDDTIVTPEGQRCINVVMGRLPFREDQKDEDLFGNELDEAIDAAMSAS